MSRNNGVRGAIAAMLILLCLPLMGSALISPDKMQTDEAEYNTAQAHLGTLSREMSTTAVVHRPTYVDVRCKVRDARVAQIANVRNEEIVEGMVLGVLRSESSRASLAQTELNLKRAQEEYELEIRAREEAIIDKQTAIQLASDAGEREIARLELQKMELQLADYRLRQEKAIADLEESLAEQQGLLQDVEVIAPVTGNVSYFSYVTVGESVGYNSVILTLQTDDPTLLRFEDPEGLWRYGMECTVEYGPRNDRKTTTARVISCDSVLPPTERTGYAYAEILGEFDNEDSMTIGIKGEEFRLDDVLLIPKKASSMYKGHQKVSILDGSSIANRYVRIGISDKENSWIIQGLSEGQNVILD